MASKAPAKKASKSSSGTAKKSSSEQVQNPLYMSKPKNLRIGGDIRPNGRDLSRYVKWPRYVRLQRQRKILYQRLKVPPAINQFTKTLDKNQAAETFRLFSKYTPESKDAKKERVEKIAAAKASGETPASSAPGPVIKFGLKHVTQLIEDKKAKIVLIGHDVDPIELVVWLPALCRKMDVPFAIVKGKARLGTLTNQKKCSVVALTKVNKEDEGALKKLQDNFKTQFNGTVERKWGGGQMGRKTVAKLAIRAAQLEAEKAKKQAAMTR